MKTLRMRFTTQEGKGLTVNLKHPKGDLTAEQVRPVMELMASKGIFPVPVAVDSCLLVDTGTSKLF
ncbi:Protein of unknown function (DUF2922) [Thermanaerovibrio velox DSM 12556]|uniref:DUF2922 family protein n=1 Tax=Thermanaerovibrio velox DSM 12556 TaxID=926567 RepID=H0UQK4_9BACT|nr:DUF2922 domain-containing protein [Thermanaerovibrio velox]EHM10768.1 Protein of unknown function (DUF2922) [Thermanaerovibrio velox DSM 12556]